MKVIGFNSLRQFKVEVIAVDINIEDTTFVVYTTFLTLSMLFL